MPTTATTSELANLLVPFVNARLEMPRDAKGYYIPRQSKVTIRALGVVKHDADIRAVTAEGVETYLYKGTEVTPWDRDRKSTRLNSSH